MPSVVVDLNDSVGGDNTAANLSSNSIDLSSINVIGLDQATTTTATTNLTSQTADLIETQSQTAAPDSPLQLDSEDAKRKSTSKKRKLDELGSGLEYISDSETTTATTTTTTNNPNVVVGVGVGPTGDHLSPHNDSMSLVGGMDANNHQHHHHVHHHISPTANQQQAASNENGHFDLVVDPSLLPVSGDVVTDGGGSSGENGDELSTNTNLTNDLQLDPSDGKSRLIFYLV